MDSGTGTQRKVEVHANCPDTRSYKKKYVHPMALSPTNTLDYLTWYLLAFAQYVSAYVAQIVAQIVQSVSSPKNAHFIHLQVLGNFSYSPHCFQ